MKVEIPFIYDSKNKALVFNTQETVSMNYISTTSDTFSATVTSEDTSIATVSDIVIDNTSINFNINTLSTEGSTNITVTTSTAGDSSYSASFVVKVREIMPVDSYTVEAVDNATYGFALNSNNYYESGNKGVNSSYAICKLNVYSSGTVNLYLDCINYAENNCDYGILSNIDTTLTLSSSADSSNVFKSFKGSNSANVQTVDYGILEEGDHYIYIKFIKDSSQSSNNDTLQFKVRFE